MKTRTSVIFISLAMMIIAMFISRAALSISMFLFVVASLAHGDLKSHWRTFIQSPLLWSVTLLFVFPLISGLWTENRSAWFDSLRIKLPLLLLPIAFASPLRLSERHWRNLVFVFVACVLAGSIWSISHYVANSEAINEAYLRSKNLITPLENDHVRFSWLAGMGVALTALLMFRFDFKRIYYWILGANIAWLIIYLHILAARTGLLCLYVFVFASTIWLIFKKARRLYGLVLLATLLLVPIAAWFLFPTFQNRLKYFKYDFEYAKDAHYLPGGNDASRIISMKAGWQLMMAHPLTGVGFGDIDQATKSWYDKNYPGMNDNDKILPSNQWLLYGTGIGIPGFILFTLVLLIPFLARVAWPWPWWLLNILIPLLFLFDISLEIQFGVFIYCIFLLAGWKWFKADRLNH